MNIKKIRKIKAFFTIDPNLYNDFINHIEKKVLNKSKLIESLIQDYMNKKN